jgi:hypothetical protein
LVLSLFVWQDCRQTNAKIKSIVIFKEIFIIIVFRILKRMGCKKLHPIPIIKTN